MKTALLTLLCVALGTATVHARSTPRSNPASSLKFTSSPAPANLPPGLQASAPQLKTAVADTFHLAWFSFDSGGLCDTQGWTNVDLTAQDKIFLHVAREGDELDGGTFGKLHALEGLQSMWCGQRPVTNPADPEFTLFCSWATAPGYGNSWDQRLESQDLSNCDSIVISYKISWDSEPGYDNTRLETLSGGTWTAVSSVNASTGFYDGTGSLDETIILPAGSQQVRFRFSSDGAWSDEDGLWPTDGAVLIDSITIEWFNAGGAQSGVFFEDFEGELPGDLVTNDSLWTAKPVAGFGLFGELFSGVAVLQEDPCFVDVTCLWGWFESAAENPYICFGENHPQQGAVPFGPSEPGTGGLYLSNEIVSPPIPNIGAGNEYLFQFLTYRDLPLDNLIFYVWSARSILASGCQTQWSSDNFVFFGGQKDWLRARFSIGVHIDPSAPEIQLSIGAIDGCAFWCGLFGLGVCHSHAPLIDEVHLMRVNRVGPEFTVRHLDLFQDTFAEDDTTTGTGRADAANDIAPSASLTILPGDSVTVTVAPIGTDANTGVGPSAYCYVAVWPPSQPGKAPIDLEAPETRAGVGTRWPLVGTTLHDGVIWACYRMDSALTTAGFAVADRYCVDLNDNVFEPCDTICYFFCADDGLGSKTYWSRRLRGQGNNFTTSDFWEAAQSPCEFQILPGGGWWTGGDILYVDDTDDRGGPVQLFFDTAFEQIGILDKIDRYDVLAPSSNVGNSLASRVSNVFTQIMPCYTLIIWSSGNLSSGLIGDGGSGPEKSDDYGLLVTFLDNSPSPGGLYFSGDNVHEELAGLIGASAIDFRTRLYTYSLANGSHVAAGEGLSPLLSAVGSCFVHGGVADELIAFGGCPLLNDFDVVVPTGTTQIQFPWPNIGTGTDHGAVLSKEDSNLVGSVMNVMGSGFSYHYIRDKDATGVLARSEHLVDILRWLGDVTPDPVGIDPLPQLANYLASNYPNPFNPTTTIRYGIREQSHVSLTIYNVAGQRVRTLVNEVETPRAEGFVTVWDGRSSAGVPVASGVYFYKLVTKNFTQTKKMVLLK